MGEGNPRAPARHGIAARLAGAASAASAFMRHAVRHAREDGAAVAFAWVVRAASALFTRPRRDPGEKAAERFLRALGYGIVARNWRSPRDPRDEADILARTPDGRTLVVVEVKRSAGPWDALERVDARKKAVLWRILRDLEDAASLGEPHRARGVPRATLASVGAVRVDLVGVRGEGRTASAVRHVTGVFERSIPRSGARRAHRQ